MSKFFTLPTGAAASAEPPPNRSLWVIRGLGEKAGVSLNPTTPETAIEHVLDRLDLILVMSVNPRFGGQSFIEAQLEKIRHVRRMIGDRPIELEVDPIVDMCAYGFPECKTIKHNRRQHEYQNELKTSPPPRQIKWRSAALQTICNIARY